MLQGYKAWALALKHHIAQNSFFDVLFVPLINVPKKKISEYVSSESF